MPDRLLVAARAAPVKELEKSAEMGLRSNSGSLLEVEAALLIGFANTQPCGNHARLPVDQGNSNEIAVQRVAVVNHSVISQFFSVVGGDYDNSILV